MSAILLRDTHGGISSSTSRSAATLDPSTDVLDDGRPVEVEYDESDPIVQSSRAPFRARVRSDDITGDARPTASVLQLPVVASNVQGILEAVGGMAFVVENDGRLVYANANGRRQIRLGFDVAKAFADSQKGTDPTITAYPFFVPDFGGHTLLVVALRTSLAPLRSDTQTRLTSAAGRWHLTRKQAEVLALAVHGHSNKSISDRFGCALRTVEAHVSSLLTKLEVESRCALVARFWTFALDEEMGSLPPRPSNVTS